MLPNILQRTLRSIDMVAQGQGIQIFAMNFRFLDDAEDTIKENKS